MAEFSPTPTFNLGVVIHETGIHADTLRAWERRYGLPEPARTEGRHRLYSRRDIEIIKWLLARQDEGMSISKAVALWRTLEAEGRDPLAELSTAVTGARVVAPVEFPEGAQIDELRNAWVEACLNYDEARAEQVAAYAFALFPAETVCFDVLFAGLSEIGWAWYRREATVQHEHFTTGLVARRINALIAAAPPPIHAPNIVVGCPPNEEHALPALLMTLLLRNRGWNVINLGADVPLAQLETMVATVFPALVVMTAHQLHTAASLLEITAKLEYQKTPLAFGGWVFSATPALKKHLPGFYLGDDLYQAAGRVEALIQSPRQALVIAHGQFEKELIENFPTAHAVVVSHLLGSLQGQITGQHLQVANHSLGKNIHAALRLGDLALLQPEYEWISGLLSNVDLPAESLGLYMRAYQHALLDVMGEAVQPIVSWLAQTFEDGV